MDVTVGVLTNLRDEGLKRAVDGITELFKASETIQLKENDIMRFSVLMIYVDELVVKLKPLQSMVESSSDSILPSLLERVKTQFNKAREAIEQYNDSSSYSRPFLCHSVLSKLNQSKKEIDNILLLLNFAQLNYTLHINAKAKAVYDKSKEGQDAARKHEPVWESVDERRQNQIYPYTINSGSSSPSPRTSFDELGIPPYYFFFCTLTEKLMEDPVYLPCWHIFEREAIRDYFLQGNKSCPLCGKKLSSSETVELTPYIWLRDFIFEWKEKNYQFITECNAMKKLTDLTTRITEEDMQFSNHALQELRALMTRTPSCIKAATEGSSNLLVKLTRLLRNREANAIEVLGCLLHIARFSDSNKEKIGSKDVIKWLLNEGKTSSYALEILLELSKNEEVKKNIGKSTKFMVTLTTLLENPDVAGAARNVLDNLSSDLKCTTMMVQFGYCIPFVEQFNSQGSLEVRASMLKELAEISLNENAAKKLENEGFMDTLIKMLSCSSSSSKSASLKCFNKILAFESLRTRFLRNECAPTNECAIPALLILIKDAAAEQQCKHDALELLLLLTNTSQNIQLDIPVVLHQLYSRENIQELLEKMKTFTDPENKIMLLKLLIEMLTKSDSAGKRMFFESNGISRLFSALVAEENSCVRTCTLKLIYCIARQQPIVLPTCPTKESIVSFIVAIIRDGSIEEIYSAAAGIISHLPNGDKGIDEILQTSNVLKALRDLMLNTDKSNELLENVLGAIFRCTKHAKMEFLIQVRELHPILVPLLSTGSPLAKTCAARILDLLARCIVQSPASPNSLFHTSSLFSYFLYRKTSACSVHGSGCLQRLMCLVKANAIKPLVDMVGVMGASEASFSALDTLFGTGCDLNAAATTIIESGGPSQILEVLERGLLPVRHEALELLRKICKHPRFSNELGRFKGVLFSLQKCNDEELKCKARVLLRELI